MMRHDHGHPDGIKKPSSSINRFHGNSGYVIQAGAVTGGVHNYCSPVEPPFDYLEEVVALAPDCLRGREGELDELARFATAPLVGNWYQWWRASPWAGKTALLSKFVLNPPEGVRIVSFFVTARHSVRNFRSDFINSLLKQLADILNCSPPSGENIGLYDTYMRTMLRDAALQCARQGERLVLVVDGLDEEWESGIHSIAGLLPRTQAAGMRVIVSGRSHFEIPEDVVNDHPLRDDNIIRHLQPSPYATVIKIDLEDALDRAFNGHRLDRDLIGLIAAAEGGLSVSDIAELTEQDPVTIVKLLKTVSGRLFNRNSKTCSVDDILVFAHNEIYLRVLHKLRGGSLGKYLDRLHKWAEKYRKNRWPDNTPEYLLRGYFRLLSGSDMRRLLVYLTDPRLQNQMRKMSGGDAGILGEIQNALEIAASSGNLDMPVIARLAVHYDSLILRNSSTPIGFPALVALQGDLRRAEGLALSVKDLGRRAQTLARLSVAMATSGDMQGSVRLVSMLSVPGMDLKPFAAHLIRDANFGEAAKFVEKLDIENKVFALLELAKVSGERRFAEDLESAAKSISISSGHAVLSDTAAGFATTGDVKRAIGFVSHLTPTQQLRELGYMISSVIESRKTGVAQILLERAVVVAQGMSLGDSVTRFLKDVKQTFGGCVEQPRESMQNDDSIELFSKNVNAAVRRVLAFWRIAVMLAGGRQKVNTTWNANAIDPRVRISHPLLDLVMNLAAAGNSSLAKKWIHSRPHSSREEVIGVAMSMAKSGDAKNAIELVESVVSLEDGCAVLCDIAVASALAGDKAAVPDLFERIDRHVGEQVPAYRRDAALSLAVNELVESNRLSAGERIVTLMSDSRKVDHALTIIVKGLAEKGEFGRAECVVNRISTLRGRADALFMLANVVDGTSTHGSSKELSMTVESEKLYRLEKLKRSLKEFLLHSEAENSKQLMLVVDDLVSQDLSVDFVNLANIVQLTSNAASFAVVRNWVNRSDRLFGEPEKRLKENRLTLTLDSAAHVNGQDLAQRFGARVGGLLKSFGENEREERAGDIARILVAAGDLERAEAIAGKIRSVKVSAGALTAVAMRYSGERAKKLVVEIVRMSDWTVPLTVPVWHSEEVIQAIREELEVIRSSSGDRPV